MIQIKPCELEKLGLDLGDFLEQIAGGSHLVATANQATAPFVQLGFDEIKAEQIERLLGYAGISAANKPIGLQGDFSPRLFGNDSRTGVLLFPLNGLERHLVSEEPSIAQKLRDFGSIDEFVEHRGDEMNAVEYLVSGVLTCMTYCRTNGQALVITW